MQRPYFLTVLSRDYITQWDLFSHICARSNPDIDICVIVFDDESEFAARKKGAIAFRATIDDDVGFWMSRLLALRDFWARNDRGFCIFCDLDNFPIKDIRDIFENVDCDIAFQIAFGHPREIVEVMGFVACCGNFFVRDTNRIIDSTFIENWLRLTKASRDDQAGVNFMIFDLRDQFTNSSRLDDLRLLRLHDIDLGVMPQAMSQRVKVGRFTRLATAAFLHPASLKLAYEEVGDPLAVNQRFEQFLFSDETEFDLEAIKKKVL